MKLISYLPVPLSSDFDQRRGGVYVLKTLLVIFFYLYLTSTFSERISLLKLVSYFVLYHTFSSFRLWLETTGTLWKNDEAYSHQTFNTTPGNAVVINAIQSAAVCSILCQRQGGSCMMREIDQIYTNIERKFQN